MDALKIPPKHSVDNRNLVLDTQDTETIALVDEYRDVLSEEDIALIYSKKYHTDRLAVCRKAHARMATESKIARLTSKGIRVVDEDSLGNGYHACTGTCDHAGLVAVVRPESFGEGADVTYYCDDASHANQPTPTEIAENQAYLDRQATLEVMYARIGEFAKSIISKFPGKEHEKLRRWAYDTFESNYSRKALGFWSDLALPQSKELDQFILMHTIPVCLPELPGHIIKPGYSLWSYNRNEICTFIEFLADVLVSAGYDLSDEERALIDYLNRLLVDERLLASAHVED